jgi:hypothetical protein
MLPVPSELMSVRKLPAARYDVFIPPLKPTLFCAKPTARPLTTVVASNWSIPVHGCVARNCATCPYACAAQSFDSCSAQTAIEYVVPSDAVTNFVRSGSDGTGCVELEAADDVDGADVLVVGATGLVLWVGRADEVGGVVAGAPPGVPFVVEAQADSVAAASSARAAVLGRITRSVCRTTRAGPCRGPYSRGRPGTGRGVGAGDGAEATVGPGLGAAGCGSGSGSMGAGGADSISTMAASTSSASAA